MELISEIIEKTTDPTFPLPDLLRLCRRMSNNLDNAEFKYWLEKELEGYQPTDQLPDYRKISVESYGTFEKNPLDIRKELISIVEVPKGRRERIQFAHIVHSIGQIDYIVKTSEQSVLVLHWNAEDLDEYKRELKPGFLCHEAHQLISVSSFVGILDIVRTRILKFCLQLRDEFPKETLSENKLRKIPSQPISEMVINVFGDIGSLTGIDHSSKTYIAISTGDVKLLMQELNRYDMPDPDIDELQVILDQLKDPKTDNARKNLFSWVGKMFSKATDGAWQVSLSVASSILGEILKSALGLP